MKRSVIYQADKLTAGVWHLPVQQKALQPLSAANPAALCHKGTSLHMTPARKGRLISPKTSFLISSLLTLVSLRLSVNPRWAGLRGHNLRDLRRSHSHHHTCMRPRGDDWTGLLLSWYFFREMLLTPPLIILNIFKLRSSCSFPVVSIMARFLSVDSVWKICVCWWRLWHKAESSGKQ